MQKKSTTALGLLALAILLVACGGGETSQTWLAKPASCPISDASTPGQKQVYGAYSPLGSEPRHTGIDYACAAGTPVLAVADGEVVFAGWWPRGAYGISVWVKTGDLYFMVGHGQETKVAVGDQVVAGQAIMLSGSTGVGNGAHVHFGVSNKGPREFTSWYEHADERTDRKGWLDPAQYLGKANPSGAGSSPRHLNSAALSLLCLIVPAVVAFFLIWLFIRRPRQVADSMLWLANNQSMLKKAIYLGFREAMEWLVFGLTAMVVLSPLLMDLVRQGFLSWLSNTTTVENWRLAVLAVALLVNLLIRAYWQAKRLPQQSGEPDKKKKKRKFGCVLVATLGGLTLTAGTAMYLWSRYEPSSYFPDFPEVTYWTGAKTEFFVPPEVQAAVLLAAARYDCDADLVVSVAFGESPVYNNVHQSSAGAAGVWQFMPGTWDRYWPPGPTQPQRTDITAAADAACRMISDLKLAEQTTESEFVRRFTGSDGGLRWNAHEGQGKFIWRLWQTLKKRR